MRLLREDVRVSWVLRFLTIPKAVVTESLPFVHVSSTSMALTFLGKADFASRFCVELPIDERSRGVGALVELSFVHDAGVMLRLGPSRWPGTEFLKYQLHIADVNRHGLHSD